MSTKELPNIVQFTEHYQIQSYFDAAAELTTPPSVAVAVQPSTNQIVPSTLKNKSSQSGFAIGLAPWSKAPVAVQINFGPGGSSAVVLLRPGQLFTPNGGERFEGFSYGLPFGWLGGGTVTLFLFKTKEATVDWAGFQSEVLFHRFRTTILTAASPSVPPSYRNWPTEFPVDNMFRYDLTLGPQSQGGKPTLMVSNVTRTLLRLNGTVPAAPDNEFRVLFWGPDSFEADAGGAAGIPPNSGQFYWEGFWPISTAGFAPADKAVVELPQGIAAESCNYWGISIVAPAGSALLGQTVDVVRYGRL